MPTTKLSDPHVKGLVTIIQEIKETLRDKKATVQEAY